MYEFCYIILNKERVFYESCNYAGALSAKRRGFEVS